MADPEGGVWAVTGAIPFELAHYDGREWRIHYWMFRKERIAELVEAQRAKEEAGKAVSVYDDVPEERCYMRGAMQEAAA